MRRITKQTAEKPRAGSACTFANCQPNQVRGRRRRSASGVYMPTRHLDDAKGHLDDAKVHPPSAKTDTRPPAGACPSPDILIGGTFLGECQRGSQPDIGRASVPQHHDLGALHTHIPLAVASCARNSAPARATGRGCHGALLVPALHSSEALKRWWCRSEKPRGSAAGRTRDPCGPLSAACVDMQGILPLLDVGALGVAPGAAGWVRSAHLVPRRGPRPVAYCRPGRAARAPKRRC